MTSSEVTTAVVPKLVCGWSEGIVKVIRRRRSLKCSAPVFSLTKWLLRWMPECAQSIHKDLIKYRGEKEAVLLRKEQSYDDVIKALGKHTILFAEDQKRKKRGFGECMTLPFQCWHAKPLGAFDLRDSAIDMQLRLLWLWWTDRISSKPSVKSC